MPSLQPVDESFFETAPQRFSHTWEINRPADGVWSELTGDQPLHWCNGLKIRWTSEPPLGVGATRTARVLGVLNFKERFFIWEEGRRHAFYIAEANLALFTSLAEDYLVEPRGEDACTFTWRAAIAPSPLGKAGAPVNAMVFKRGFSDTGKYFGAV